MTNHFNFKAKVWVYDGPAAWHFISVPVKTSTTIKKVFGGLKRGWGSLRVQVQIGCHKWQTSIFPDNKTQTYLLPLKKEIRSAANIKAGQTVAVQLEILT